MERRCSRKIRALFDENVSIGIKSGLGMHLIRDLSKAINAEIIVNSKENTGTRISILIETFLISYPWKSEFDNDTVKKLLS